jgi:hypothetical protein
MLILPGAGAGPSNLIVPVIVPAVAASTGCPAGAVVAAGVSVVSSFFPQLTSAMASAAVITM